MTIRERLEEIKAEIAKLDESRANVEKAWAEDVKKTTSDPKFDLYSKKADKILEKVADRYTPLFLDIDEQRDEFIDEYNRLIDKLVEIQEEEKAKKSEEND